MQLQLALVEHISRIFFLEDAGHSQRLIGKVAIGSPQHTDAPCHLFWICMQLATHVISVYSLRCSDVADHQGIHLAISTATLKVSSAYFCLHEVFLAFAQSLRCSDVAGHLKPHCQGRHITRYLCRFVDSLGVWAIVWQEKMSKLAQTFRQTRSNNTAVYQPQTRPPSREKKNKWGGGDFDDVLVQAQQLLYSFSTHLLQVSTSNKKWDKFGDTFSAVEKKDSKISKIGTGDTYASIDPYHAKQSGIMMATSMQEIQATAGSSNGQYRVSITAYSSDKYLGPLPNAPTILNRRWAEHA